MQHRHASVEAVVAAAIALGIDALYVSVLAREGEGDLHTSRAQFVTAFIAVAAACAATGALAQSSAARLVLLSAAGIGLIALGVLAFSFVVLLVVPALLSLGAAAQISDGVPSTMAWRLVAGGGFAAVAVLWAGIWTTT